MNEENGIPKRGELPGGIIPIDRQMSFNQSALWYSRFMLTVKCGVGKHVCPVCGDELIFRFCEVYADPYMEYVMARCDRCKVSSDACYYPRYNISPIDLARGAIQTAINEFEKRVKR